MISSPAPMTDLWSGPIIGRQSYEGRNRERARSGARAGRSGIGAFEPLPEAAAKVSSPNRQRSFGPGRGKPAISSPDFLLSARPTPPSEPPEDQLDEGEGQEGGQVSAGFSKSLARRRLRPNQETQSTTQRRGGETKPFVSSLRLTI